MDPIQRLSPSAGAWVPSWCRTAVLVPHPAPAQIAHLGPVDACHVGAGGIDRGVDEQGVVRIEVAVLGPVHLELIDRVQPLRGRPLPDAVAIEEPAHVVVEVGARGHDRQLDERGGPGVVEVGSKLPETNPVDPLQRTVVIIVPDLAENARRARRRRRALEMRRLEAVYTVPEEARQAELDEAGSGSPGQHVSPVEGQRAGNAVARGKVSQREVVGIRHDAELGIVVVLPWRDMEGPAVVGTRRIGGPGQSDALNPLVDRELAQQPAVGQMIVEDDRVAVVVVLAGATEAHPDGISG